MAKSELLTELKAKYSSFVFIGKAGIKDGSLGGVLQKEGKTWKHVDSSFSVGDENGSRSFVRIYGGYKTDDPKILRFNNDNELVEIPWKERNDEKYLEELNSRAFLRAKIEKDEDGKLIERKFIHEIDFEEYLREHLEDGMEVTVTGNVEYSPYEDRVFKRYNVSGIYLNESYKRNGEVVDARPHGSFLKQTYLLEKDSLPKNWEKELESKGEFVLSAMVPQYMSSKKIGDSYVKYKKVDPVSQNIIVRMNTSDGDENYEKELKAKKVAVKKFFTVKRDVVREIGLMTIVNEGYKTGNAEIEIDKEMQELIDAGVISEEDVKSQMTVQGNKVDEIIYSTIVVVPDESGMASPSIDDDKYAPEALIVPEMDDDEEDFEPKKESKKSKPKKEDKKDKEEEEESDGGAMTSDAFDALFS